MSGPAEATEPVGRLKSPRTRLFIALDLPETFLDDLVEWQRHALGGRDELRLLPKESLHITLIFLGYQAERDVERISTVTFEEPAAPFELHPKEVVSVPPRRPRLYAVAMEEGPERLTPWQGRLSERLERVGFYKPEKRPFWPHLTVARLKRDRRTQPTMSNGPPPLAKALTTPFQARALTLYKSTLRPQGALYEPLATVDL